MKALDSHVTSQKHLKRVPTQPPLTFPTIVKSVDSSMSSKESKKLKQHSIGVDVFKQVTLKSEIICPVGKYMFKVNNRNTKKGAKYVQS